MPYPAVLLDLDGTLVDSAPDLASALNRTLADYGLAAQPLSAIKRMVGDGTARLVARGFEAAGQPMPAEAVPRFLAHYEANLCVETRLYPGVVETLETLSQQDYRLAICTNKPQALSEALLERLDLARFFPVVVGGDRYARRKPDPLPLLEAMKSLGAESGVMIGDSRNDVLSGKAARLPTILVSYGYRRDPVEALAADAVVANFPEILAQMDNFLMRPEFS